MSESPVISYLHYLQEVSRKILLRSGFENVLYKKPKRHNPCYFDLENSERLQDYLLRLRAFLQRDSSRGLYLGFGLFVGQVERNQRKRNIAAPLFFCAVDLDSENDLNAITHEIRWNSITLNYDLITMILEQRIDREDEELLLPPTENLIAPEKLKMLSEIEDEFERRIEDVAYQNQLSNGEKLSSFVNSLKRQMSEFDCVKMSDTKFNLDDLNDLVQSSESLFSIHRTNAAMSFFNHRFFFVAPVPDQLATYIALRELIGQIKD